MKTIQQLQDAVNDLREVCIKHGIVLLGTCSCEGIYGEILIAEPVAEKIGWTNVEEQIDNLVRSDTDYNYFFVNGIGRLDR